MCKEVSAKTRTYKVQFYYYSDAYIIKISMHFGGPKSPLHQGLVLLNEVSTGVITLDGS